MCGLSHRLVEREFVRLPQTLQVKVLMLYGTTLSTNASLFCTRHNVFSSYLAIF
jgi:hypothetical protein